MNGMRPEERSVIDDQIAYYSARAPEYDATARPAIRPQDESIEAALRAFEPGGNVLEIACGTGAYTGILVAHADDLTALDASAEMIELARAKVSGHGVRFIQTDIFEWEPDSAYDCVFFGFWISHVPPTLFDPFWELVRRCLGPGGRVAFVDESFDSERNEAPVDDEPRSLVERRLEDGTIHRVVKVYWRPEELAQRLRATGWDIEITTVGPFYWGAGAPI
jgi:ubiquinone/menaquinone biosynthesis C-methylase UbiE